ncbi:MAG: hypothetical protein WCY56_01670 [Aminobacteriaceae bacterium]
MNVMVLNSTVLWLYYAIVLFFGGAVAYNLFKTKKAQEAVLYSIILVPFVLRLLRLK